MFKKVKNQNEIKEVVLQPVYNCCFVSAEHAEGELEYGGDAIGRDCMVTKFVDGFMRMYSGDGSKNEAWFGWDEDVLAPCDSIIEMINEPISINEPGKPSKDRSGIIFFRREDGVNIMYAHVKDIKVKVGDTVKSGDIVAKLGNNGMSFMPHLHVGAFIYDEPLQIRFNLREMGKQIERIGKPYYFKEDK